LKRHLLFISAALAGAAALPALADMVSAGAMEAKMICRPAVDGERPSAEMMSDKTKLVCRPLAIAMRTSDGKMHVIGTVSAQKKSGGPDLARAVTPQQINDTWVKYLETTFHIDRSP